MLGTNPDLGNSMFVDCLVYAPVNHSELHSSNVPLKQASYVLSEAIACSERVNGVIMESDMLNHDFLLDILLSENPRERSSEGGTELFSSLRRISANMCK